MSGAKFHPVDNLDQLVARMIVDNVQDVVQATEAEAKRQAPPTKKWVTAMDVFVRRTHRAMHGEEIPSNLRFKVQAYQWDVDNPDRIPVDRNLKGGHQMRDAEVATGQFVYMAEPRDHATGAYVNNVACRCQTVIDPDGVAKMVGHSRAKASGTKVSGTVYAEGKHVHPAEYGDEYPGGFVAEGTMFMHKTVVAMGNRA